MQFISKTSADISAGQVRHASEFTPFRCVHCLPTGQMDVLFDTARHIVVVLTPISYAKLPVDIFARFCVGS